MTTRRRRPYSNEFPTGVTPRRKLEVDFVPPALFQAAKRKARREGVSLRVTVLRWLTRWVES